MGHIFLQAIDDCFPKNNPLHKIFNRNNLKLSYSCMPNIRNIISVHNKSVVNKLTSTDALTCSTKPKQCNCRNKSACPLPGKYLTSIVAYQATVVRNDTNQMESQMLLPYQLIQINLIKQVQKCDRAEEMSLGFCRVSRVQCRG